MKSSVLALALAGTLSIPGTAFVHAETDALFAANYDIVLTVGARTRQARSRSRVQSGEVIPVEFKDHKVELLLTEEPPDRYGIEISILELSQGNWYRLNSTRLTFEGEFGIPKEFSWVSGDLALEVAVVVSPMPPSNGDTPAVSAPADRPDN